MISKLKAVPPQVITRVKTSSVQNIIAEQKLRTQRILGELIKNGQKNGEPRKPNEGTRVSITGELTQVGLNKKQSHTFQQIASIPEEDFEKHISENKNDVSFTGA